MKVVKIGGGCLKGLKNIQRIMTLAADRCQGDCLVVSALNGITDRLIAGMDQALTAEDNIPKIINHLASVHLKIAGDAVRGPMPTLRPVEHDSMSSCVPKGCNSNMPSLRNLPSSLRGNKKGRA